VGEIILQVIPALSYASTLRELSGAHKLTEYVGSVQFWRELGEMLFGIPKPL